MSTIENVKCLILCNQRKEVELDENELTSAGKDKKDIKEREKNC